MKRRGWLERKGPNPSGLCMCGCGSPTALAKASDASRGYVGGTPLRWLKGHDKRRAPVPAVGYVVNEATGCWEWRLRCNWGGYGVLSRNGWRGFAHRWFYEQSKGPIPPGLTIDHLCRVRNCVNPAHLEAVTMRVNNLRGMSPPAQSSRKTHCLRGHSLLDEANVRRHPARPTTRICRKCAMVRYFAYGREKRNEYRRAARGAGR